jgi:PTH1 family peptidyl-tRNA hydrolase
MPRIPIPVLVCSLGNSGIAYANTLHSAGHVALRALHEILNDGREPTLEPFRPYQKGQVSDSAPTRSFSMIKGYSDLKKSEQDITLWSSGSLMNVSGPAVKKVWDRWRAENDTRMKTGKLIIVHDDLDGELGKVKVKTDATLSAK